jgi:hypothetical protein
MPRIRNCESMQPELLFFRPILTKTKKFECFYSNRQRFLMFLKCYLGRTKYEYDEGLLPHTEQESKTAVKTQWEIAYDVKN